MYSKFRHFKVLASNLVSLIVFVLMMSCTSEITTNESLPTLYRILVGDKYGFMDQSGKVLIEPQFDDAPIKFYDEICWVKINEHYFFIDRKGAITAQLPNTMKYLQQKENGLFIFSTTTSVNDYFVYVSRGRLEKIKMGVLDRNAKVVIPDVYSYIQSFSESGTTVVRKADGNWCFADCYGNIVENICYNDTEHYSNGLCAVEQDEKWGYIDETGKMVISPIYDYAEPYAENGIAAVVKDGEQMFIDKKGNKLFSVDEIISDFRSNRTIVVIDGDTLVVDNTGKKVCCINADEIRGYDDEGFAVIYKKNGETVVIDTLGNVVLKTRYDYIGDFIDGVASVSGGGFIDVFGNKILQLDSSMMRYERNQSELITLVNKYDEVHEYYDTKGNLVWKDLPTKTYSFNGERQGFVEYYDDKMADLDPIEGIYYVTTKSYYQNRENPSNVGLNSNDSKFYAVVKFEDGYSAFVLNGEEGTMWRNRFVKIGESNMYAITKQEGLDEDADYPSGGRVILENPMFFDFKLELGHNDYYNFFSTYEFIKDYPSSSQYEKLAKAEWSGTGFAISDGYVVTNYHVTEGAKSILIRGVNGDMNKPYKGYVVAFDKEHDISVIKIIDAEFDSLGKIPYDIGRTNVEVGDEIFVLGYPMTSSMGEEIKLTNGIVSSKSGYKGDESLYQISAAVQPGNSGGPLFNSDGTVVAIVCGKHAEAENANYAIKISHLYRLIATNNLAIKVADNNRVKNRKLSKKIDVIKDFVYMIECRSR